MRVRTESLIVTVDGRQYELSAGDLAFIAHRREVAASHKRAYNAPAEAHTRRELRQAIEDRMIVSPATARAILREVKTSDLYVVSAPKGSKPDHLDLAVRWDRGWKTYTVTGTRHAYYLLRKLAEREGFQGARLNDLIMDNGRITDNVIALDVDDITGSDRFGKYRALLDRKNSNYDLAR